jgi:hypothetical protein
MRVDRMHFYYLTVDACTEGEAGLPQEALGEDIASPGEDTSSLFKVNLSYHNLMSSSQNLHGRM